MKYPNYIGATKYNKNVLGARFLRRDVIESVGRYPVLQRFEWCSWQMAMKKVLQFVEAT